MNSFIDVISITVPLLPSRPEVIARANQSVSKLSAANTLGGPLAYHQGIVQDPEGEISPNLEFECFTSHVRASVTPFRIQLQNVDGFKTTDETLLAHATVDMLTAIGILEMPYAMASRDSVIDLGSTRAIDVLSQLIPTNTHHDELSDMRLTSGSLSFQYSLSESDLIDVTLEPRWGQIEDHSLWFHTVYTVTNPSQVSVDEVKAMLTTLDKRRHSLLSALHLK